MKKLNTEEIKSYDNTLLILNYTKEVMRLNTLHNKHKEDQLIIKENISILGAEILERMDKNSRKE